MVVNVLHACMMCVCMYIHVSRSALGEISHYNMASQCNYFRVHLHLHEIRQKHFNKKYCNVGMTQQWSLAKKLKKINQKGMTSTQQSHTCTSSQQFSPWCRRLL